MDLAGIGWLPWRPALALGLAAMAIAWGMRRSGRTRASASITFEVGLVLTLYAAWQFIGSITPLGVDRAYDSGRAIAAFQAAIGLPSEADLQSFVLPHDWAVLAADTYYTALHIPVFVITLLWVLLRHGSDWPFVRTTTVLLTGSCLLIQFWAVAPPRLIPDLGIIDTAMENGRSVYAAIPGANQLSAMPSVHMAWSVAVALFIIVVARSPWRWLALMYPSATMAVVVVTGNHFWMDGIVSMLLLGFSVAVTLAIPSQRPRRVAHPPQGSAVIPMGTQDISA